MRSVRDILSISLIALLILGSSLVSSTNAAEFKIVVKPDIQAFTPSLITIKLGDEVTWINNSNEEHFLTTPDPLSRGPVSGVENLEIHKKLQPGDRYANLFKEAASYYCFCAIHSDMWGTVTVEKE
jgi:plastocyanin